MMQRLITLWQSKRRQVVIAWLAAWPTLTTVLFALQPFSQDWPLPLKSLASATAMVVLMNFVSVPIVSSLMRRLLPPLA